MQIPTPQEMNHPSVPAPAPFRQFMTHIGPVMLSVALGLGCLFYGYCIARALIQFFGR